VPAWLPHVADLRRRHGRVLDGADASRRLPTPPGVTAAGPAADASALATRSHADTAKTLGVVGIVVGALG